ncbi:bacteriophage HK97-gp10 putative tail-component [Paenibacillus sp. BK033]|uniref:HK97 gp10 family phage protein n=1 Tax=Paenibacillus sp. BK033 TaxID=2512133 RepID=UPI00104D004A|nr:HK97 gp10 family phage protein [Paenibacillus sp. BK033]TCM89603.1 bacteriophage HK97-gp10 putative tail-component [Paenibacillus sp. BK033]
MPTLSFSVKGLDKALKSAKEIPQKLLKELDDETERAALRVVNDARTNAPVLDGFLRNSIKVSGKKKLQRVVSSDRPYARRQEYEHPTKRGFFRKAMYKERITFREAIEDVLKKVGD